MASVGEELINEIERVAALRVRYKDIGPAGTFGVMTMTAAIEEAKKQIADDDPVAAIRALKELQKFTD